MNAKPTKQVAKVEEPELDLEGGAKAPSTNKELQEAEVKTEVEKVLEGETIVSPQADELELAEEGKLVKQVDPSVYAEMQAYISKLERQVGDLQRLVNIAMKGKPLPASKRDRPAGLYRLNAPLWDGRKKIHKGTEMSFVKGAAPQSATFLAPAV